MVYIISELTSMLSYTSKKDPYYNIISDIIITIQNGNNNILDAKKEITLIMNRIDHKSQDYESLKYISAMLDYAITQMIGEG